MGVDKDGNYRDVIFAPETKHALKFMFNAARRGYFDPSQMTFDDGAILRLLLPVACSALSEIQRRRWASQELTHGYRLELFGRIRTRSPFRRTI